MVSIVIIDLVLSGDTAVVIRHGCEQASGKSTPQSHHMGRRRCRRTSYVLHRPGGAPARCAAAPAAGAFLLLYIAFKLLKPVEGPHEVAAAGSLREALQTIILADVVMSLDNILAVGGAAHGHLGLLIFGLALSVPILLFGSSMIARAIDSYPILNYIGSGILVITATRMFSRTTSSTTTSR
ncbi:MAG: hypothetical protein R3A46_04295 [Thermomicrobiales bacterium]